MLETMAPIGKGLPISTLESRYAAGAEVIESKDNWNYSRSLLLAWAITYFHCGGEREVRFQ